MYDQLGQRTSTTHRAPTSINAGLGGLLDPITSTWTTRTTSYTYDAAGQMTTITDPDGTTTIDYDPAGRRTSATGPDTTTAYTYDPRGRLATVATDDGATTDSAQRDWDATDTLTALTTTADGATATTTLAWDPTGVVPQILRMNHDSEQVDFVYGHNRALALTATGVEVFAHDYLGSTLTTPATAHLATADTYSPYGQPADGGSAAPTFGYRGELHTGDLIHLRARDYQPATGAFLSTDPLDGVPGHTTLTNPYHYAHNNPLIYTDPLGLRPWNDQDMRGFWTDADGHNIPLCAMQSWGVGVTFGIVGDRYCASSMYVASTVIGGASTAVVGTTAALARAGVVTAQTCVAFCGPAAQQATTSLFGQLTYASQGIQPYRVHQKFTAGHGGAIHAHHLIEQRFANVMGGNLRDWLSIVVTRAEHQVFTNAWRQLINTGPETLRATPAQVEAAARVVYRQYPEILRALGL